MDNNQPPKPAENPVLEEAAKEIAAILKKHDIAGVVQMFTPGFNKYAMHLAPSWSVVAIDTKGQLRMIAPIVDPDNEEAAKAKILDTVRMLANMRIYLGKLTITLTQAEIATRQYFGVQPPPPKDPARKN
jgi:hypothetical protein